MWRKLKKALTLLLNSREKNIYILPAQNLKKQYPEKTTNRLLNPQKCAIKPMPEQLLIMITDQV